MIVIASDPSISFPKAAGKKADERVECSLYRDNHFPHPTRTILSVT